MRNLKVSQKLIVAFTVVIALFTGAFIYQEIQVNNLAKLQDEGALRSNALVFAKESSAMGYKMYQVVADAVINRDLNNTQNVWGQVKTDVNGDLGNLEKVIDTDTERDLLKQGQEHINEFIAVFENEMMPLLKANSSMDSIRKVDSKLDILIQDLDKPLTQMVTSIESENSEADKTFDSKAESVFLVSLVVNILAIAVAIIFTIILVNLIAKPLVKGLEFAKEIAKGNLYAKLDINQKDEVGDLASALQEMVEKLTSVINEIIAGSENILSASSQMSNTSQAMSQGATEQASSAEEVSASMEQMSANIQQNTDNARVAEKISIVGAEQISKSNEAAQMNITSMREIADKVSIISDIAFQTNILALNAAVEAARAGEQGRGFAVVAAEVRKLAERSKVAAEEIARISKKGVLMSDEAGKMLEQVVPEIQKTARLVQEIAAASTEQNSGADQVNSALQQLNQVTQQNAAASEEMATSSEELASQAEQLKDIISYFKVEKVNTKTIKPGIKQYATAKPSVKQPNTKVVNRPQSKQPTKGVDFKLSDSNGDSGYEKF